MDSVLWLLFLAAFVSPLQACENEIIFVSVANLTDHGPRDFSRVFTTACPKQNVFYKTDSFPSGAIAIDVSLFNVPRGVNAVVEVIEDIEYDGLQLTRKRLTKPGFLITSAGSGVTVHIKIERESTASRPVIINWTIGLQANMDFHDLVHDDSESDAWRALRRNGSCPGFELSIASGEKLRIPWSAFALRCDFILQADDPSAHLRLDAFNWTSIPVPFTLLAYNYDDPLPSDPLFEILWGGIYLQGADEPLSGNKLVQSITLPLQKLVIHLDGLLPPAFEFSVDLIFSAVENECDCAPSSVTLRSKDDVATFHTPGYYSSNKGQRCFETRCTTRVQLGEELKRSGYRIQLDPFWLHHATFKVTDTENDASLTVSGLEWLTLESSNVLLEYVPDDIRATPARTRMRAVPKAVEECSCPELNITSPISLLLLDLRVPQDCGAMDCLWPIHLLESSSPIDLDFNVSSWSSGSESLTVHDSEEVSSRSNLEGRDELEFTAFTGSPVLWYHRRMNTSEDFVAEVQIDGGVDVNTHRENGKEYKEAEVERIKIKNANLLAVAVGVAIALGVLVWCTARVGTRSYRAPANPDTFFPLSIDGHGRVPKRK